MNGDISIKEAAEKWGLSVRRVNQYCTGDRIHGLIRFGRSWAIHADTEKPSDTRCKAKKEVDTSCE